MSELTRLSAFEARQLLDAKAISASELTDAHLQRIADVDDDVHAFLHVMGDVARQQATAADEAISQGQAGAMTGIPVALKDILCTTDAPTTAASKLLSGYVSPYDATVVKRLRDVGAVFVGKTNTDEFAMGSSTENSGYVTTRNPWNLDTVPGGSSGGSAAAVAAHEAVLALGSDTGGSIRQPAGFCGVVGLKPTYGRVSRFGSVAFASSLDQIGPFGRTVQDAALMLNVVAGKDANDATSADEPVQDFSANLPYDLKGKRIGVARDYLQAGIARGVQTAFEQAVEVVRDLGAQVVDVAMAHTEYALAAYYIIAPAEASANLSRYDGIRFGNRADAETLQQTYLKSRDQGFGPEVKRRIMLGTYALSSGYYDAYYVKAQKVRTLIKRDFDQAFEHVDAIMAPTSPTVAFNVGARTDDPYEMYLSDMFTIPTNLAGIPGVSVPGGMSDDMPVGLQFLGRAFDEHTILSIAHAYEQATEWHTAIPSGLAGGTATPDQPDASAT